MWEYSVKQEQLSCETTMWSRNTYKNTLWSRNIWYVETHCQTETFAMWKKMWSRNIWHTTTYCEARNTCHVRTHGEAEAFVMQKNTVKQEQMSHRKHWAAACKKEIEKVKEKKRWVPKIKKQNKHALSPSLLAKDSPPSEGMERWGAVAVSQPNPPLPHCSPHPPWSPGNGVVTPQEGALASPWWWGVGLGRQMRTQGLGEGAVPPRPHTPVTHGWAELVACAPVHSVGWSPAESWSLEWQKPRGTELGPYAQWANKVKGR